MATNNAGGTLLVTTMQQTLHYQWLKGATLLPTTWQTTSFQAAELKGAVVSPSGQAFVLFKSKVDSRHHLFLWFPNDSANSAPILYFVSSKQFSSQALATDTTNRFLAVGNLQEHYAVDRLYLYTFRTTFHGLREKEIDMAEKVADAKIIGTAAGRYLIVWQRQYENNSPNYLTATIYDAQKDSIYPKFRVREIPRKASLDFALSVRENDRFLLTVGLNNQLFIYHITFSGHIAAVDSFSLPPNPYLGKIQQIQVPSFVLDASHLPVLVQRQNEFQFQLYNAQLNAPLIQRVGYIIPDSTGAFQIAPKVAVNPAGRHLVVWKDFRNGYPEFRASYFDPREGVFAKDKLLLPARNDLTIESMSVDKSNWAGIIYKSPNDDQTTLMAQFLHLPSNTVRPLDTLTTGYGIQMRLHRFKSNYILGVQWQSIGNAVTIQLFQGHTTPVFTRKSYLDYGKFIQACGLNDLGNIVIAYQDNNNQYYYKIITFLGETLVRPTPIVFPSGYTVKRIIQAELDSLNQPAFVVEFSSNTESSSDYPVQMYGLARPKKTLNLLGLLYSERPPRLRNIKPGIWSVWTTENNQIFYLVYNDNLQLVERNTLFAPETQLLRYPFIADGATIGDSLYVYYESAASVGKGIDVVHQIFKRPTAEGLSLQKPISNPDRDALFPPFPNPTRNDFNILVHIKSISQATLELYNIQGQKLKTLFEGFLNPGNHLFTFSTTDLPAGIYFIRLKAFDTSVQKIVIIR